MKTINIFLYFYKNKNILNIINLLNEKSSKKNILFFDVYDQDNEKKYKLYENLNNVKYNHVFWDKNFGVSYFRNKSLQNNFDYFLELKNLETIAENWDEKLINCSNNSICLTGNNIPDMNLIFIDKTNSCLLSQIYNLKFYGQEIKLLYLLYKNSLKINYLEDRFCSFNKDTLLMSDYVPYSLYHGYNKNMEIINNDDDFILYCNKNNIAIDRYKPLAYQVDDLDYSEISYVIDYNHSEKFHKLIKMKIVNNND
jgi:hypothetical protein